MAALVTVDEMKVQLRILEDDFDAELGNWIETAHGRIVRYIKSDDETITYLEEIDQNALKIAEIVAVKALFEGADDAPMTQAVKSLLVDFRDPTLA